MIVTVALPESAAPSFALYVNSSLPKKLASGTYWNEPSAFSVTVPWPACETSTAVSGLFSGSLSLTRSPVAVSTVSVVSSLMV